MAQSLDSDVRIAGKTLRQVKQTWKELHHRGGGLGQLRPIIADSWERSRQFGVDPYMRECCHTVPAEVYAAALQRSEYLASCATPVMRELLEFFRGTGFIGGLMDANGVTLKAVGDPEALEWAKRANLSEGTVWTEQEIGTNAASLCMSLVKPVTVCGYEHYALFGIVSAACFCPLLDEGRLVGAVGMVAPYDRLAAHTLGMVVAAAMHIQSVMRLRRISMYHNIVLDSMSDGLLAVNGEGRVTHFNQKCAALLGFPEEQVLGKKLFSILSNAGENQYFYSILSQNAPVTDEYILLDTGKNKIRCNLTCTPIRVGGENQGTVVILREYERVNQMVGKWMGRNAKFSFREVLGADPGFLEVVKNARAAASSSSNVLLLGESGTGKDVIAQAMHNESYRRSEPFVAINCAALPRELIASELFGYEEGAFTGARKGGNTGKFELANNGTIFLDEIGDLPIDLQATLLRVLEEKGIQRLGGNKFIPINVRIIAATNRNLPEEIEKNRFRRDLYYRLGVIKLSIPPLRERRGDIVLLAEHFLASTCARFGKADMTFSPEALELFCRSDWPGNVRELQNVIECLVQLNQGSQIGAAAAAAQLHLPPGALPEERTQTPPPAERSLEELERARLEELLAARLTKDQMAARLGISRRTLYRHLKRYGLLP